MNLVGELVLARNQVLQMSTASGDDRFLDGVQRLNRLTTELQAGVMKTRMQPIDQVLGKFPRIVRDLAVACNKKVRLEIEGQDTLKELRMLFAAHGIGIAQKDYMDIAFSQVELDLMKAIKAAFDPKGILNPGKMFPG